MVFDAGHPEDKEEGGRVYEVTEFRGREPSTTENVQIAFGHGDLDFGRIQPGAKVWKTSDPELEQGLLQTFEGETPRFQRPISMEVHGLAESR